MRNVQAIRTGLFFQGEGGTSSAAISYEELAAGLRKLAAELMTKEPERAVMVRMAADEAEQFLGTMGWQD